MVQKFRKKPQIIEAVQWAGDNYDEIQKFSDGKIIYLTFVQPRRSFIRVVKPLMLKESDGTIKEIYFGNWIIKESDGNFSVFSELFTDFYEVVE